MTSVRIKVTAVAAQMKEDKKWQKKMKQEEKRN
jgi:hypothetical protein